MLNIYTYFSSETVILSDITLVKVVSSAQIFQTKARWRVDISYFFKISVKSRSPCFCNSILLRCKVFFTLFIKGSMPRIKKILKNW